MPEPTPTPTPTPDPSPDPDPGGGGGGTDPLEGLEGEPRRLVERANAEAASRRREARAERQQRERLETELAEFRRAQESESERLVREAEQRGFDRAAPMVIEAEMAIAAAGLMHTPGDAALLLNEAARTELLGMSDPAARRARAAELVSELLESRPYMALDQGGNGSGAGGPLVTQGARSQQPPGAGPTDPDAWLRGEARRRG